MSIVVPGIGSVPVVWKGNLVDLSGSDSDGEVGRRGLSIEALVHHRIVGSLESAINEFTDATASGQSRRVSSHLGIGYIGSKLTVVQFVAFENTAYCNGQGDADRAACDWRLWKSLGRPGANYITVSTEHEDNGANGDYVVVDPIIRTSIEVDRLLLSGDGDAIRAAGFRCSDGAAAQLGRITPSTETIIDHNVIAPVSKPFCWRPIGDDRGFPQARWLRALEEGDNAVDFYALGPAEGTVTIGVGRGLVNLVTGEAVVPETQAFPARARISLREAFGGGTDEDRRRGYLVNYGPAGSAQAHIALDDTVVGFDEAVSATCEPIQDRLDRANAAIAASVTSLGGTPGPSL